MSRFVSDSAALAVRKRLVAAAMESYDPHLVIIDRMPFGIANELEEPLYALRERSPMSRIVVGLWDVEGEDRILLDCSKRGCMCDALDFLFDEIWLYGTSELYPSIDERSIDPELARKLHFTGYLRHVTDAGGAEKLASEDFGSEKPFVLVTLGGGSNGYYLVNEYLNFLEQASPSVTDSFQSHIVCGPMMSTAEKKELDERVEVLDFASIERFHKDLNPYINAASVVVSTAGYNTCCQLLSFKKRAVVVPRADGNREQIIRGEFLRDRGLVEMIHPDELDSDVLGAKVLDQLRRPRNGQDSEGYRSISLDGLENIAKRVIENAPTFIC